MNIIQKSTPNFRVGRGNQKPEIVVIHIMAGSLAGTDSWFASPKSGVSSNYGVGLNGEIHQYVADENMAWANGIINNPTFKLLKAGVNPNLYTLSIENEGQDLGKAPEAQLNALAGLVASLMTRWNIPCDRDHLIGHYQVDGVKKINCPSPDHTVIDKLLVRVQSLMNVDETVQISVPKSKLNDILNYINNTEEIVQIGVQKSKVDKVLNYIKTI